MGCHNFRIIVKSHITLSFFLLKNCISKFNLLIIKMRHWISLFIKSKEKYSLRFLLYKYFPVANLDVSKLHNIIRRVSFLTSRDCKISTHWSESTAICFRNRWQCFRTHFFPISNFSLASTIATHHSTWGDAYRCEVKLNRPYLPASLISEHLHWPFDSEHGWLNWDGNEEFLHFNYARHAMAMFLNVLRRLFFT